MTSDNLNHRPALAALVGVFMMLIFGLSYRSLAAWLGAPLKYRVPIDVVVLERLPSEISGWAGQDIPLDEAIVRKTNADAHINRRYSRSNGSGSVGLYLACGVRARDLVAHRPEVCYTGAGWTLVNRRLTELAVSDGTKLPCSLFSFSRGHLDMQRITVLHYFIVDGCYYGDVTAATAKTGRRFGMADYVAQVHITSSGNLPADLPPRIVCDFAVDSAPSIIRLFGDISKDRCLPEGQSDTDNACGGIEGG